MATATRLNYIEYGATGSLFKVGVGTNYHLHDTHHVEKDYDSARVSFQVVVRAATEAALKTLTDALEAAYRLPNGDLNVSINGAAFVATTQAAGTGMNARPGFRILPAHRTNYSRCYFCWIDYRLPADETGKGYRYSSSTTIQTGLTGIDTLLVEATYTGGGSASALANAKAGFPTFVAAQETATGGLWDSTDVVEYRHDDENKVCPSYAQRTELIQPQSSKATDAAPDDVNFSGAQYTIRVFRDSTPQLKDSGAHDFMTVVVEFSVPVRKTQSTDLKALFTSHIEPHLKDIVISETSLAKVPIMASKEVGYDVTNNSLFGTVRYRAAPTNLIKSALRVTDYHWLGAGIVPVADGGDGYAADIHPGPRIHRRNIFALTVNVGDKPLGGKPFSDAIQAAVADGFVLIEFPQQEAVAETWPVFGTGESLDIVETVNSAVLQFVSGGGAQEGTDKSTWFEGGDGPRVRKGPIPEGGESTSGDVWAG